MSEIVAAAEQPDFNTLLEITLHKEKRAMLAYVSRSLKGVDPQDVLHDVVVKALAAKEKFISPNLLGSWLWVILKRHIVDLHRKASTRKGELPTIDMHCFPDTSGADPESIAIADETNRDIQAALAAMPPEQAEALRLWLKGSTGAQIAEAQDVPLDTARSRIFKAQKKVRGALNKNPHRKATSPSIPPQ